MTLFSSWEPDMLAYFTWYHAAALLIALLVGAGTYLGYINRKYDGGEIETNWEWRRGTGTGTRMRNATRAEVYRHLNKGRSYEKAWKKAGRWMCVFGILFATVCALMFPQMVGDASNFPGHSWATDYRYMSDGSVRSMLPISIAVVALAMIAGFRLTFGVFRLIKLRRREKSDKYADRLTNVEEACMGLAKADFIICLAGIAALVYPTLRAILCVFGPGAAEAARLPELYYNGTLLIWQLGVSAAILLWSVVYAVLRGVKWFNTI